MTILVGFGAVNSGNNLLYLVLGTLLSLIIISGVLSELTLRGVTAIRYEPPRLFANSASLIRIDLCNTKRRVASLSVEVTELTPSDSPLMQRRGFVLRLPPNEVVTTHLRIQSTRRGVVNTAGLRVATRYPFGFFEKSRFVPLAGRYVVYPALRQISVPGLPPVSRGTDEEQPNVGRGDEFYGLRDASPEDDARTIAWKVTARRDKVVVRENQRPATQHIQLLLHNVVPKVEAEAEKAAQRESIETLFEHAASIATSCMEAGYAVGLTSCEGHVPAEAGASHLVRLYEHLAHLPVRIVPAGTSLPALSRARTGRAVELALVTEAQRAAALAPSGDRIYRVSEPEREDTVTELESEGAA